MHKSYNDLMGKESGIGIIYEFTPIDPVTHNELIMKAINLFGESGLYLLIGKIEAAGNDILETTWFLQAMQKLCRVEPFKVSEFQLDLLSHVKRSDLNMQNDTGAFLRKENLLTFSEFSYIPAPGNDPKDPIVLLNRLTMACMEEWIIPFVSMLSGSDIMQNLIRSLTTWLGDTAQMSIGSSGAQSERDSSQPGPTEQTRKKRESRSGIFTKRGK